MVLDDLVFVCSHENVALRARCGGTISYRKYILLVVDKAFSGRDSCAHNGR